MRRALRVILVVMALCAPLAAQLINPNPGAPTKPVLEKTYKDGFVEVFGPRPFGPRDRKMVNEQGVWDREHQFFQRIDEDAEFSVDALVLYQEIGIGFPVQWSRQNGQQFVAFPDARYSKIRHFDPDTVKLFPGTVWRVWLVDSAQKGFCVPSLARVVPGLTSAVMSANCAGGAAITKSFSIETNDGSALLLAPFKFVGGKVAAGVRALF